MKNTLAEAKVNLCNANPQSCTQSANWSQFSDSEHFDRKEEAPGPQEEGLCDTIAMGYGRNDLSSPNRALKPLSFIYLFDLITMLWGMKNELYYINLTVCVLKAEKQNKNKV